MTAAVDLYVWSVADAAEYNSHGMSGDSWFITRATGADIPTIRANLAAIRAAAAATTVGTSGTGAATLSIQMFDSYDGQVTVTVSPASATGTLHLDGATVAGTPADTAPVTNGSVIPIRGTPLDSQTEEYAITASATFTVTNSGGYLGQIGVYTTGSAQRLAGPGGQAPASYSFSAADYVTDPLELQFEPIVTTQVSDAMVQPGDPMVDVLTAGLSATSPAGEWRACDDGRLPSRSSPRARSTARSEPARRFRSTRRSGARSPGPKTLTLDRARRPTSTSGDVRSDSHPGTTPGSGRFDTTDQSPSRPGADHRRLHLAGRLSASRPRPR